MIPDSVIFGISREKKPITYGDFRRIEDQDESILLFQLRLERFFVDQVRCLSESKAAFPLAIMACIGVETLGEIFLPKNKDDASEQFVMTLKKVHQRFGRKPSKKMLDTLKVLWKDKDLTKIDSYAKIVYRFFRNSMIHGYRAEGVFLSYEDTDNLSFDESSGFIVLNPEWMWKEVKSYFFKLFGDCLEAQDNHPNRRCCISYISTNFLN